MCVFYPRNQFAVGSSQFAVGSLQFAVSSGQSQVEVVGK